MDVLCRNIARGVLAAVLLAAGSAQSVEPPPLQTALVEVDLSGLPASEKLALAHIIHAARRMDALYVRQVWPGTPALLQQLGDRHDGHTEAALDAVSLFKGPWDDDGKAFLPGVPATRPMGDFYPAGASKDDIQSWLATLSPSERERAMGGFTAIRRNADGRFTVEPYSRYYAGQLQLAATDLRAAAALTHEPTLKRYLLTRARALLDDNYYASDVAFVNLGGPIDVVLGPYEVYDDSWFGAKTTFEASISLINQAATQRSQQIASHLQELEDHLPLAPELRGRKLAAAAPILVLDVVYDGGFAGQGGAIPGYGLPNDLRVLNAAGARTGTYDNVLRLRYDHYWAPVAAIALPATDRDALHVEDIRDEITMVRLFDSLGPQVVTGSERPIADALKENWAAASQIRPMLLSLWGHRYLIEHGYLDNRPARSIYAAFLVPALSRLRDGLGGSAAKGSTYILNCLLDAGAIQVNSDGQLTIDVQRADAEVMRAANEFISAMARGDAAGVQTLLQQHVFMPPVALPILKRLKPAPFLQYVYKTADELDPP